MALVSLYTLHICEFDNRINIKELQIQQMLKMCINTTHFPET